tara:strand:- start:5 stop:262 length:258 start_codon:yes stop_codon:yes gene_type:complete
MKELKENRYLLKGNSYIIDLYNVDFITWKENDKVAATYWAKLHIGSKEARFVCNDLNELKTLVQSWTDIRGKKVSIQDEDLINEW